MKKLLVGTVLLLGSLALHAEFVQSVEIGVNKGYALTYTAGSADEDSYLYGSVGLGSIGVGYEHVINADKDVTIGGNLFKLGDGSFGNIGVNFYQNGINQSGWYGSIGLGLVISGEDDNWLAPSEDDEGNLYPSIGVGYRF